MVTKDNSESDAEDTYHLITVRNKPCKEVRLYVTGVEDLIWLQRAILSSVPRVQEARAHSKSMLIKTQLGKTRRAHHVIETEDKSESDAEDTYHLFTVRNKPCKLIIRNVIINGVTTPMELDAGAAYSVIV